MALTVTPTNNKLIKFRKDLIRAYRRQNKFSRYMGTGISSIIREYNDLKDGGEQINVPFVSELRGIGVSTGTLVGNEERIEAFGGRFWIDWARHAVVTNKKERHVDSADVFEEARPLLTNWGKDRQRDDIILALHALPNGSVQSGLGVGPGNTVNGILYTAATTAQKNTWHTNNADRVLYGAAVSNYVSANHAGSLANIDNSADKLTYDAITLMKRRAKKANIYPYMVDDDGEEMYVLIVGSYHMRDLMNDPDVINLGLHAYPREGNGRKQNPLFTGGDLLLDNVIVREVTELDDLTTVASNINVAPTFMLGQSAVAFAWGQLPKPTMRDETDYQFLKGVGIEMAYGVGKFYKEATPGAGDLQDNGVFTGYFASVGD